MAYSMADYLNDNQIYEIDSWEKFQKLVTGSKYKRWAFRGHQKSEWILNNPLLRYLTDFKLHRNSWAHQEDRIIRLFRRKAELFLQHVPKENDIFQWLALMQHHGAPTRLLDFTWSPFVAAFFALEKAKTDCAVWAVNFSEIQNKKYNFQLDQVPMKVPNPWDSESYRRFFIFNTIPFIIAGEPYHMNQRQIAQSGTFLVPGIIDKPIEEILSEWQNPEKIIVKFILKSSKIREQAMESLYYMNITYATLFPGLDGLARSLAYELEFHWAFNPKTMEDYPGFKYFDSNDS
jgi:hypothetical protein